MLCTWMNWFPILKQDVCATGRLSERVCLWQGPGQRRNCGTHLWQTLYRPATWEPSQSGSGVITGWQSHWACVGLLYGNLFVQNVIFSHIQYECCIVEMVSLISGMFQICFPITSAPPTELKPNLSVSYTKVRVLSKVCRLCTIFGSRLSLPLRLPLCRVNVTSLILDGHGSCLEKS